jgi:2-oxoglutarate dehydrogenase E1 component
VFDNIFETVNSGFAQTLYEDYLRDPESVPPEWRQLFENGLQGEEPIAPGRAKPQQMVEAVPPPASPATGQSGPGGIESITGPALRLLENMEASLSIPTATSFRDIDVSLLWDQRRAMNRQLAASEVAPADGASATSGSLKLSFTHFIGWAVVLATRNFPAMVRAVVDKDGAPHRLDPRAVNLGLAVDTTRRDGSRHLVVPVIRGADRMTFREFHTEYERLVARARAGTLLPDAYQGATITLTNPGTIGTVASVPRLMKGQGSIIATGAIRTRGSARVMTLTCTYDHRIIQGAESGSFLQLVDGFLQGEEGFYADVADAVAISAAALPGRPITPSAPLPTATTATTSAVPDEMLYHVAAAMGLVKAHRTHGYLAAQLDPLGTEPIGDPALDPEALGLTPEIMQAIPANVLRVCCPGETLADVLPALQETYCGSMAYEIEHIANHEERVWLRCLIEEGEHREPMTAAEKRRLYDTLVRVEGLENFLHRAYLGHKRFGIEGLDTLVPMLHYAIETAADHGAQEVVLGMAHRGRLNVLAHVLGVPYETLLAEFEGGRQVEETLAPKGGVGDVKYHHGARGEYRSPDGDAIKVNLMPNPSHLEAVNPVVEGYARAVQTKRLEDAGAHDPSRCLPVLIHGDAAFAAQGVVAETFNLARLEGYGTGGTLHIIANNQVGFTTDPREARSTDFSSDLSKGFDAPIVHVNADDPEACLAAVRLAMMYREKYRNDCVIDLVGYRRHGHNEGDEPRYTQPLMYERIANHPAVRQRYSDALIAQGVLTAEDADAEVTAHYDLLVQTQKALLEDLAAADQGEEPVRIAGVWEVLEEPDTAVSAETLAALNDQLLAVPEGFTVNPKLSRQLERRRNALTGKPDIDWAHAEALAFASLLLDGIPLRLTGQDTERGTFSQRHLVLHDAQTGERYAPIQHLEEAAASFELHNSPLSEYGVLGFEYGYSVCAPETLVLWEAQFGDFANNAEVIIDQFIIAGLAKWGQTSRLVLLLPHGYEGQGPEHSSARLERYLALGAEGNIRVANCSTPAQYFHLLRRQALISELRPIVVMTPKSLLRLPQASSTVAELSEGRFRHVLDDTTLPGSRTDVTRLVLCSGKIFYDIVGGAPRPTARHVAVGRIELLYPFPQSEVAELIRSFPNVREVVWAQEEPNNMGARKWVVPQLMQAVPEGIEISHVSRPELSSPAEGYPAAHKQRQAGIVLEALGDGLGE